MTGAPSGGGDDLPPTIGPDSRPPAPSTGELVGTVLAARYRILRLLGEGAMGSVFLGEHVKIGRRDAIKVLNDNLAGDPDAIARFIRGTRNVSLIRHPNICTIYDYSDTEHGLQFVAMEYVSGETLRDLLLREGRLPVERSVRIAMQVASALQAAHEAGIVHRDLKPANIMVTPGRRAEDEIKVVDFDIAKGPTEVEGEEVTRHGFVVGTPEYMSPEQLIGERLDGRSDLYSLALVLFRMLTGVLPFRGEGAQELMVKRLTEVPMRLADALPGMDFPPALDDAIRRALSRKPEDRQADAEEFGSEIGRSIGEGWSRDTTVGSGAIAAPAGAPVPLRPGEEGGEGSPLPPTAVHSVRSGGGDRRGIVLAGSAGAALLVAAVAGVFLVGGGNDRGAVPEPMALVTTPPPAASDAIPTNGGGTDPPSAQDPGPAAVPADAATTPAQTATPSPAAPSTVTTPAAVPVPSLSPTAAGELLVRLLDRFGPPDPNAAALRAIRDSARLILDSPQSQDPQRARAAYIMASALLPLGDTLQAVGLLERAIAIEPNNRGYNTLLNGLPAEYRSRVR